MAVRRTASPSVLGGALGRARVGAPAQPIPPYHLLGLRVAVAGQRRQSANLFECCRFAQQTFDLILAVHDAQRNGARRKCSALDMGKVQR
jgi:hypothetical protein